MINKNPSGDTYYGGNEIYLRPAVKGTVNMSLTTARKKIDGYVPSGSKNSFYSEFLSSNTPISCKKGSLSFA